MNMIMNRCDDLSVRMSAADSDENFSDTTTESFAKNVLRHEFESQPTVAPKSELRNCPSAAWFNFCETRS